MNNGTNYRTDVQAQVDQVMRAADVIDARNQALIAEVERLRAELAEVRVAAEQGVLVARDLEEKLRKEREAVRAALERAAESGRETEYLRRRVEQLSASAEKYRKRVISVESDLRDRNASLVEAATFARGVVGKCNCLTCAPATQLAERWESQARGTP